jgi:hypothetical protein
MYARRPNREGIRERVTRHKFDSAPNKTPRLDFADCRTGQVSSITLVARPGVIVHARKKYFRAAQ